METKDLFNRLTYILIFSIASVLLEIIAFATLGFGVLPTYFMFDLAYILIVCGILFLIPNRKAKFAIVITLISLQVLLNCVNVCYYKILGDIFSFDLLKLGIETKKVFDITFIDWASVTINVLCLILVIFSLKFFTKKQEKSKIKAKPIRFSAFAIVMCFVLLFSFGGVSTQILAESTLAECSAEDSFYIAKSDVYLYNNFQFKQEAFKKFGTFGFYIKSFSILSDDKTVNKKEAQELTEYLNSNIVSANENAVLKDDNLIMIMLESFEWFAIDPICTPTLWALKENYAQSFTNFYGRNKTNISESIGILGNTLKTSDFVELSENDKFNPTNSLPNLFKNEGYTANFFHSYDGTFYNRYNVNKKYGFENVYALQDAGYKICNFGDFYLEEEFLSKVIDKLAPTDKQFFSFYTTVGTHGPYNAFNPRYNEYLEFYEDNLTEINKVMSDQGYYISSNKGQYTRLKEYKCAAMDTDRMIKYLLEYLNDNNILDNTTIVLYADHNTYYDNVNLYARYNTKEVDPNSSEVYNIPFMIYSQKLGGQKIDTFCNTYDIYPTVCELFGLSYSKNFTQGYNVYSEDIKNSVFVSNLTGIYNDRMFSYNITDVINFDNLNLTDEEIYNFQLNAVKFFEKQEKIDKIYINFLNS